MLMWTGLTWVTMPLLSLKFGYLGVSYAVIIIATSSFVTILMARKYVNFNFWRILRTPVIASLAMSLFLLFFAHYGTSVIFLLIIGLFAAAIYFATIILIEGISFISNTLSYFRLKHD